MNTEKIKLEPQLDTLRLLKIDDKDYFENYKNYISNSRLSLLNPEQDGNEEKFINNDSKIYSDSIILGSAVHELFLQGEYFEIAEEVNRPTAKTGFMADELYGREINEETLIKASDKIEYYKGIFDKIKQKKFLNACENYFKARKKYESIKHDKTPIYINNITKTKVKGCLKSLYENKEIMKLVNPEGLIKTPESLNENAILIDIKGIFPNNESYIIHYKAKVDNFTIDKETSKITVNDLKTTGGRIIDFKENFNKFHYYRELFSYCWLINILNDKIFNIVNPIYDSNCLVVSTIPLSNEYLSTVYKLTKNDFDNGKKEFVSLLKKAIYVMYEHRL